MGKSRCTITDCDRPVRGHGLCQKHYTRWRRYGDPLHQRHRSPGDGQALYPCRLCGAAFLTYHVLYQQGYVRSCLQCRPKVAPRQPRKMYTCQWCGAVFSAAPAREKSGRSKFCSRACLGRYLHATKEVRGPLHPNWKGGVRHLHNQRGFSRAWRQIREQVFERDAHCCQQCGLSREASRQRYGQDLCVHHITRYLDTRDDAVENLQTLCCRCHGRSEYGASLR